MLLESETPEKVNEVVRILSFSFGSMCSKSAELISVDVDPVSIMARTLYLPLRTTLMTGMFARTGVSVVRSS